jgi:hypothetical protein
MPVQTSCGPDFTSRNQTLDPSQLLKERPEKWKIFEGLGVLLLIAILAFLVINITLKGESPIIFYL